MEWERLIITLGGYGAVPCLCVLLETFWDCQQVVPRQNLFHGPAFPSTRGKMQVVLVSLKIFNVVVDIVIRIWSAIILEEQRVAHDGLGETIGRCLGVFYANDGMVGTRDPDWL